MQTWSYKWGNLRAAQQRQNRSSCCTTATYSLLPTTDHHSPEAFRGRLRAPLFTVSIHSSILGTGGRALHPLLTLLAETVPLRTGHQVRLNHPASISALYCTSIKPILQLYWTVTAFVLHLHCTVPYLNCTLTALRFYCNCSVIFLVEKLHLRLGCIRK